MIHEDAENIGYWIGPDEDANPKTMVTLAKMISLDEQESILLAAFSEHKNCPMAAESARWDAGYGGL